jgi:prevent-host-death family protein
MSKRRVSVAEAKNRLPALIHEVEASDASVEITRRGKTVAVLSSTSAYRRDRGAEGLVAGLARIRAKYGAAAGFTNDEARSLRDRRPARDFTFDEDDR